MVVAELKAVDKTTWKPDFEAFSKWLAEREEMLDPGLLPEPTIKVLVFLALLDSGKPCTYDDLKEIFAARRVIQGVIPDNTLRTSVLSLGKTLNKFNHKMELKSFRGRFQLLPRTNNFKDIKLHSVSKVVTLCEPAAVCAEEIAHLLFEKTAIPFHGIYFLDSAARSWEIFSNKEAEIRIQYEAEAWDKLGIRERLNKVIDKSKPLCVVSLAGGEGFAEIGLLRNILNQDKKTIHYLAVDSSQRLLRNHMGLLEESLSIEIETGHLLCAGVVADFFVDLKKAIKRARIEFKRRGLIENEIDFLPAASALLITYFGNSLGNNRNNNQDQETEFFSVVHSIFQNRPLEVLVGVSVKQSQGEIYAKNWYDFLLVTPQKLLTTKKILKSHQPFNSNDLPEFSFSDKHQNLRFPQVKPEPYIVRHQIEGHIYRFYYKLAFDLELVEDITIREHKPKFLPKGTLILLCGIIKYNMDTLIHGVKKSGLFKISYNKNYHRIVDTANGKREYAVFSAYLEE